MSELSKFGDAESSDRVEKLRESAIPGFNLYPVALSGKLLSAESRLSNSEGLRERWDKYARMKAVMLYPVQLIW